MKRYFLDTSVIIDYLRGKSEIIEKLDSLEGEFVSSTICLAELFEGVYRDNNPVTAKDIVQQFFSSLSSVYTLTPDIAETFGELRASLKRRGAVIEDIDLFIAATCITENLPLITRNIKHFSRVPQLVLV